MLIGFSNTPRYQSPIFQVYMSSDREKPPSQSTLSSTRKDITYATGDKGHVSDPALYTVG